MGFVAQTGEPPVAGLEECHHDRQIVSAGDCRKPFHSGGAGNIRRDLGARLPKVLGVAGLDIDGDVLGTGRAGLRGLVPVQRPFPFCRIAGTSSVIGSFASAIAAPL
ncbi:MAG: hypothetical protein QM492_04850 [Rhodobacterales bacterium]